MDSTVIQEIANQLGIAVDEVGQFITEYLPTFAAMKSSMHGIYVVTEIIVSLLCVVAVVFFVRIIVKEYERDAFDFNITICVSLSAAIVIVVCFFCVMVYFFSIDIRGFIGWSNYPEAMLIDMALKAVG